MGGGHRHRDFQSLLVPGDSCVHRLPADVKIVVLFVYVISVAITSRHAVWAFVIHAALLATVAIAARVPASVIARRVLVVAPFLIIAVFMPFIGDGPLTRIGPIAVSTDGLWAAWSIIAKAVLGAAASIVLTATTPIAAIPTGLTRLHVPAPVVAIVSFMIRYLDLIAGQLHRMRLAMTARGYDPQWLWHARPIASAAGTLFVRAYERGERIHQAMIARGFTGHMPDLDPTRASRRTWAAALLPAGAALATALTALTR